MSPRIRAFQQFRDSIPRDRWCCLHGPVTRYHGCKATEPEIFGEVALAFFGPLQEGWE
jgi:hypothetical protein